LAALLRHHPSDTVAIAEARRDLFAAKLEDHVRGLVAAAPPLTADQRRRLAAVLADRPADD
jgi:hypothetical protein